MQSTSLAFGTLFAEVLQGNTSGHSNGSTAANIYASWNFPGAFEARCCSIEYISIGVFDRIDVSVLDDSIRAAKLGELR